MSTVMCSQSRQLLNFASFYNKHYVFFFSPFHSHFTEEETEAQRDQVVVPGCLGEQEVDSASRRGGLSPGPICFMYFCTLMGHTLFVNMMYYCLVGFNNFHKLNPSMNNFQFIFSHLAWCFWVIYIGLFHLIECKIISFVEWTWNLEEEWGFSNVWLSQGKTNF